MNRSPLLAFGRVDGRENYIIFIAVRRSGNVAGRLRRIQREFTQKAFPARVARSHALQIVDVGTALRMVLVQSLKLRQVPALGKLHVGWPGCLGCLQRAVHLHKDLPFAGGAGRHLE